MNRPPSWIAEHFLPITFFFELGLGLVGIALAAIFLGDALPFEMAIDRSAFLLALLASVPPAILAAIFGSPLGRKIPAFDRIFQGLRSLLDPALLRLNGLEIFVLAGAAGVGEEILFRGVVQKMIGLYATSAIFGLLHFLTPTYFLLTAGIGLYLGWLQETTGNLAVPILVHWLYDMFALSFLRWMFAREPKPEVPEEDSEPKAPASGQAPREEESSAGEQRGDGTP